MRKKKKVEENIGVKAAIEATKTETEPGSQSALARLLNVSQPTVFYWLYRYCPPEQAIRIEAATGVKRELICPQIFGANV